MEDVENGEDYASVGAGVMWEISVPIVQFCCELQSALKNKSFKKDAAELPW